MKLSLKDGARCIAYIQERGKGQWSEDDKEIFLNPEGELTEIDLTKTKNPERTLFPCFQPRTPDHNNRIFVSAPTGAGKTTFVSTVIQEYKNRDPDKHVYIFSPYERDKSIDTRLNPEDYTRITPDDYTREALKNSFVVCDDIESLEDDKAQKKMNTMIKRLLQAGRHDLIDTCLINHTLMDYQKTKKIIGESNYVVLFPNNGNDAEIENYLKSYVFGRSKSQQPEIDRIVRMPMTESRWVVIHKGSPMYVVTEKKLYFPNKL